MFKSSKYTPTELLKNLLYIDLGTSLGELFLHRDLGLLTKALGELGHDAWLVVHPAIDPARNQKPAACHEPFIGAFPADVRNPKWWQSHQSDLVILGLWTRPKYDPIRRAALSRDTAGHQRSGSDGMRTASCGLLT